MLLSTDRLWSSIYVSSYIILYGDRNTFWNFILLILGYSSKILWCIPSSGAYLPKRLPLRLNYTHILIKIFVIFLVVGQLRWLFNIFLLCMGFFCIILSIFPIFYSLSGSISSLLPIAKCSSTFRYLIALILLRSRNCSLIWSLMIIFTSLMWMRDIIIK